MYEFSATCTLLGDIFLVEPLTLEFCFILLVLLLELGDRSDLLTISSGDIVVAYFFKLYNTYPTRGCS